MTDLRARRVPTATPPNANTPAPSWAACLARKGRRLSRPKPRPAGAPRAWLLALAHAAAWAAVEPGAAQAQAKPSEAAPPPQAHAPSKKAAVEAPTGARPWFGLVAEGLLGELHDGSRDGPMVGPLGGLRVRVGPRWATWSMQYVGSVVAGADAIAADQRTILLLHRHLAVAGAHVNDVFFGLGGGVALVHGLDGPAAGVTVEAPTASIEIAYTADHVWFGTAIEVAFFPGGPLTSTALQLGFHVGD